MKILSTLLAIILTVYQFPVEITRCYDGDTCTVNIDIGLDVWRHSERIRLDGINAPEIRGDRKWEGKRSKDHLLKLIRQNSPVSIKTTGERGKYGRLIARIVGRQGLDLNEQMVTDGYAEHKEY